MLLTIFRGKEGATYERPLRGMTLSQMREIIRGTILDGHDENDVTLTDEAGETTVLWTMREFMQGIVYPLVRRYQRWVDAKPEGYWEVERPAYCEALHEAVDTEVERVTGELARRLIDMYARM